MTVVQWIITSGAVVSAVAMVVRTVVWPVVKWARRIEKAVSTVESNMVNNGGSSMRDAIDRIEARLVALEDHVTKPEKQTVQQPRNIFW